MHATLQYVFDYASEFILDQGAACKDEYGNCFYDGPNGKHCIVGCLLRPGKGPLFEGEAYDAIPMNCFRPEFTKGLGGQGEQLRSLLGDLQSVHDQYSALSYGDFHDYMVESLFRISSEYGFDPGILITWIEDAESGR